MKKTPTELLTFITTELVNYQRNSKGFVRARVNSLRLYVHNVWAEVETAEDLPNWVVKDIEKQFNEVAYIYVDKN